MLYFRYYMLKSHGQTQKSLEIFYPNARRIFLVPPKPLTVDLEYQFRHLLSFVPTSPQAISSYYVSCLVGLNHRLNADIIIYHAAML